MDFSGILRNEHKGFEHERLYVFDDQETMGGSRYDRKDEKGFLH